MSWEPISKSLGSVIDEKLSSPLLSSFSVSWALINWKFFVILFSQNTVTETFDLVEATYFSDPWTAPLRFVIFPAVATFFYLFVLPRPSQWVYRHWRRNQQKTNRIRQEFDDEQPLTIAESQAYRRRRRELEEQHEADQKTIEQLVEDATKAESELKKLLAGTEQKRSSGESRVMDDLVAMTKERDELRALVESFEHDEPQWARNVLDSAVKEQFSGGFPGAPNETIVSAMKHANIIPNDVDASMLYVLQTLAKFQTATAKELQQRAYINPMMLWRLIVALREHHYLEHKTVAQQDAAQDLLMITESGKVVVNAIESLKIQYRKASS